MWCFAFKHVIISLKWVLQRRLLLEADNDNISGGRSEWGFNLHQLNRIRIHTVKPYHQHSKIKIWFYEGSLILIQVSPIKLLPVLVRCSYFYHRACRLPWLLQDKKLQMSMVSVRDHLAKGSGEFRRPAKSTDIVRAWSFVVCVAFCRMRALSSATMGCGWPQGPYSPAEAVK